MAEKFIHINVAAKIPTLADCVKLKAGQSYSATIVQGDDYDGNSGVNSVFNNFCSEAFTVPSINGLDVLDILKLIGLEYNRNSKQRIDDIKKSKRYLEVYPEYNEEIRRLYGKKQ